MDVSDQGYIEQNRAGAEARDDSDFGCDVQRAEGRSGVASVMPFV